MLTIDRACCAVQMGKTIGVVGLGRIGREVAGWSMNFGMQAVGYDPIITDSSARAFGIEPVSLDEVRRGGCMRGGGGRGGRRSHCLPSTVDRLTTTLSLFLFPYFLGG